MAAVELCFDTNILIDFLKNREPGATALEKALSDYHCGITSITHYELLYGMARARYSIGEEVMAEALIVLPLDRVAAALAARLHADLVHANQDIGVKDTLIAAICLSQKVPLLTANIRHFSRVAGLNVLDPHWEINRGHDKAE
jgi:predicted nucleic acid-binding protein